MRSCDDKRMSTTSINKKVRDKRLDELPRFNNKVGYYDKVAFSKWLNDMIERDEFKEKNIKRNTLAEKMSFSPGYFNDLSSGRSDKKPSREVVIEIGLTMGLSEEEINYGLQLAGYRELNGHYLPDRYVIAGIASNRDKHDINNSLLADKNYEGDGILTGKFARDK